MRTAGWTLVLACGAAACGGGGGSADDGGTDGSVVDEQRCPGGPACPDEGDGRFLAGAARVDLTPEDLLEGPSFEDLDGDAEYDRGRDRFVDADGNGRFDAYWIAGFDTGRPATGVHDPMEARIVALRRNATTVVVVGADLIGFFHDHLEALRERLAPSLAAEIDLVLWSSSHVHEVPDTMGMWGPDTNTSGLNRPFLERILDGVAAGIGEAVAGLEPVRATHGSIRVREPDGSMEHLFHDGRDPVIVNDILNVMRFEALDDGETVATLVNLGYHPEALWSRNTLITADFVHYLRNAVEEGVPGRFDGVGGTAVFVQGTCGGLIGPGHVTPLRPDGSEVPQESFEAAQVLGETFAEFALRALSPAEGAVDDPAPDLRFRRRRLELTVDNWAFQAASLLGIFERSMHNYDPTLPFGEGNTPDIRSEVVYLQIGEAGLVTFPGEAAPEVFLGCYDGDCTGTFDLVHPDNPNPPDLAAAPTAPYLRDDLIAAGHRFHWAVGLGQDEVGYIVPDYDYQLHPRSPYVDQPPGDHYEETNSLGPRAHAQITEPLRDTIRAGL